MSSSGLNLEKYRIPLAEIIRATDNFSSKTLIGDGGFGMVHKGQLSELWQNPTVAIKRLDRNGYQGNNEFLNELEMVSSFHHPNIIPFIGYCDDGNEMIIVYEYAVHGSLDRHLQDPYKRRLITWTQRLKICLGVAKGLKYLHSGVGEHKRVIHRDMKSANILLDDNLEAKICDFGLSRFGPRNQPVTQLVTKASGTRFYMDPIYNERGILRKESDIYSLGVVLFEMSSGTLAYQGRCFGDDAKPQYLVNLVRCYYDDDRLDDEVDDGLDKLIDPYIKDHIEMSSFNMFNEIAHQCINIKLKERPTMDRVIEGIEEALNIQERNPILTECVMKDKIFYQGKHVAGFTIYKWLHRWKSFEAETTSVFEQLIKIIDVAIKDCTSEYTIYLSSNVLTLLFLIQGCLKLNDSSLEGFGVSPSRVSFVKFASELEEAQQIEAKYPTLLFKKQLTTYIEKMYGIICYNMKVELRSLVTICIDQAPQTATQVQIFAWSDDEDSQPSDQTNNWEAIVDFLNTLLNTLKENFVPRKIVQQIFAQLFSYINVGLFNSILSSPKFFNFNNLEYLKAGLDKLDSWCSQATKEYSGLASKKLVHCKEASELLVVLSFHYSKTFVEISKHICPSLSLQQLERLCTLYRGIDNHIPAITMHIRSSIKMLINEDSTNEDKNFILLEDNSSQPFLVNELLTSCKAKYVAGGEPATVFTKYPAFHFIYD